jgi:hypothetical protein
MYIRLQNAMHQNQHVSHSSSMRRPTAAGNLPFPFNGCRVPAHPPWSMEKVFLAVMPGLMGDQGIRNIEIEREKKDEEENGV